MEREHFICTLKSKMYDFRVFLGHKKFRFCYNWRTNWVISVEVHNIQAAFAHIAL